MVGKYITVYDLSAYKKAFALSNYVWNVVLKWDFFARDTVGKQFVKSVDSISANIAEGFGRYGKKDKINFYRYSFGSLREAQDWNEKSKIRKLLTDDEYLYIPHALDELPREVNNLIKFTNEKLTI